MNIYEIEGADPNDMHSHFGFGIIDLPSQGRQDYWAPKVGHSECMGRSFKTIVDWLGCVRTDFFDRADAWYDHAVNHGSQKKFVNKDMYLDTNGVWTLHVTGYYGWGKSYYINK